MYNVIGDIAGQYKTFLALVEKMPQGQVIALGDIIDRGPQSRQVVEWFMNRPEHEALYGNHEDLMLDHIRNNCALYGRGCWWDQGGEETSASFDGNIPESVLDWISERRLRLELNVEGKKVLLAHCFPTPQELRGEEVEKETMVWNRRPPVEARYDLELNKKYDVQITGHNSQFGLRYWNREDGTPYGICIDTSRSSVLTGIHLPTMQIYSQAYIE